MYDEILEAKNEAINAGKDPRLVIFNRISYAVFISELSNGEAFQMVNTGTIFGLGIAVLQMPVEPLAEFISVDENKIYFEVI